MIYYSILKMDFLFSALCTRTFKKRVLIFFQHKQTCHKMKIIFGLAGLNAAELHGDLTQAKVCNFSPLTFNPLNFFFLNKVMTLETNNKNQL